MSDNDFKMREIVERLVVELELLNKQQEERTNKVMIVGENLQTLQNKVDRDARIVQAQAISLEIKVEEYNQKVEAKIIKDANIVAEHTKAIEEKIDLNTAMTKEVVDLFSTLKGGFKVLGWIGNFAKWATGVGAALGLAYTWWHSINPGGKM